VTIWETSSGEREFILVDGGEELQMVRGSGVGKAPGHH